MGSELWVCNVGRIGYRPAVALQERLRAARQQNLIPDTLLLLEHPPVLTRGRRSEPGELTMGEAFYAARGIEVIDTTRGGKITYHGPGQLVGYGIVRIEEVRGYVLLLEQALVAALAQEGITAHARPEDGPAYTGVWVENRKIASIGVHVSQGVTMHGFALNVDNDLTPFSWVIACGLPSVRMTSIVAEEARAAASGGSASDGARAAAPAAVSPDASRAGAWADRLQAAPADARAASARLRCVRKRVAFALAQALGHRQRLVTKQYLEIHAARAREALAEGASSSS